MSIASSKKRILITGATGFIGKYIVEHALKNDYEVFLAIREKSDTSRISHLNFKKIVLDFSSQETISKSLSSNIIFDTVIHNAGLKASFIKSDYHKYNVELTKNICTVLKKKKLLKGKFIYISSLAALGPGDKISLEDITENRVEKPISSYGKSKLLAEKEVLESGLNYTILRPTAVYGQGTSDYKDLIKITKNGFVIYTANPNQHLSFIHAEDVARVVFLTDKILHKNQIFNVSDGKDYTLTSLYEIVASALKVKIKYKFKIPFFLVLTVAQFNYYIEKFFKITNSLNSIEKANEVTALNWKCSAKKLKNELNFTALHSLKEIID